MFWVTSHPFDSAPAPLRARPSRDSLVKGETRDICMDKITTLEQQGLIQCGRPFSS